jgi:hypothetical protein
MVKERALGFSPGPACALALLAFVACRPDTEGGASLIDGPRVLAIRSVPAEIEPGKPVQYSALYATPTAESARPELQWALCTARKPLAVAGPIALECLQPTGPGLQQLGKGDSASATIPADGCRVFGPSPPAPKMGEPAARPADPDSTGGYFQPMRVMVPGSEAEYAIGFTRIACGAGSATQDQTLEYAKNYRPNENPALDSVLVDPEGVGVELAEVPEEATQVASGQRVTFRATWADCPLSAACGDGICGAAEDRASCAADCATARGCTGSEPYVYLDPIARELVQRREAMRVSWFASTGTFAHDRSGRAETDADSAFSDNDWTAPSEASDVRVWVVLRDDRGGVGYRSFYVHVE